MNARLGDLIELARCGDFDVIAHGCNCFSYDFNLAFDEDFDRERFFGSHVFGKMLKRWPPGFRERMEPLMKAALAELPAIFTELPLEWLHVDGDESLPVQLDMKRVISALELPFSGPERFWKLP